MADKCIGRLTLDISKVKKEIDQVNEFLSKIGANINIEDKIGDSISKALKNLVSEAKKAGEEAQKALNNAAKVETKGGIESTMSTLSTTVKTYVRQVDEAGEATTRLVSTVQSGFDAAGNKIKEFANAAGEITKRTEEVKDAYNAEVEAAWKAYDEAEKAEEKKAEAAVQAGLKREEAARKASAAEQERSAKEVSAMDAELAKRQAAEEAALDKKVAADAAAQERLRQQAIDTAFARDEAAQKAADAEAEQIQREVAMMDESVAQQQAALDKQVQAYEDAEERKRQASIASEFERDEARQKAADAEAEQIQREVAMMDESLAQQEAALDKQVQAYEEAEEKKKQASIKAEFEKEEARKKAIEEEEELIQKEIAMMDESIQKQQDALQKQFETSTLNKAQQAYVELTDAIKNYNIARSVGDKTGMETQQARIAGIMQELAGIQKTISASEMEADVKQKIKNIIMQCTTAEAQHAAEVDNTVTKTSELGNQLTSLMTRYLSIMAIIRGINALIRNTVEYVSEYSDKMNEIQIITGKSSAEIEQLGNTYRDIAKEMSVSSLDMADAAIYFTRQGLEAEEIEKRLRNTTMYAKTANIEFETAAELITAVVNSMNLVEQQAEDGRNAAQRVADVFLKIGDNAATSGKEIGEAMQKAGAAAGAFNMNFEWLASYIATVSETTRQEATSIGTAFNTLIARLHSIRTTGFNSEDETKINDIQKALNNINVTLLDQEGNWRDMTTIFQEVADKWDTLDGKTKSYIATTMAGVKQQNVFLALMEDLSQKTEGTSRAWELYNLAINSAGTASEKYAVYTDSVAAAQERLTVAQEKFYSLLDDSVIKGWYDGLASVVNTVADGAKAWGTWGVMLPAITAAVGAFIFALRAMNKELGVANVWLTLVEKHPIMIAISAAIAALGVAVGVISAIASSVETTEEKLARLNNTLSESQQRSAGYIVMQKQLGEMMDEFVESGGDANSVLNDHADLLNKLSAISPAAKKAVDELRSGFDEQSGAVAELNAELEKYLRAEQLVQASSMVSKLGTKGERSAGSLAAQAFMNNGLNEDIFKTVTMNDLAYEDYGLPAEFMDTLYSFYKGFKDLPGMTDSDAMGLAGQSAMKQFFQGMTAEEFLRKEAGDAIDSAMSVFQMTMDQADANVVRDMMQQLVFGADGEINSAEYDRYAQNIAEILTLGITKGFDVSEMFGEGGVIRSIAHRLFGKEMPETFEEELSDISDDPELMRGIIDAYRQLVDKGFSDQEIADVLGDFNVNMWADAIDIFWERVLDEIREKTGRDALEGFWSALGLDDLMYINKLLDSGVGIGQIEELMAQFTSEDNDDVYGFIEALHNLGKEAGVVAEETTEAAKDPQKELKAIKDDIDNIDSALKSLEEKKPMKFKDLLDLTAAHPELLSVMNDAEQLKAKLEDLKATGRENMREKAKEMLRGTSLSAAGLGEYATDEIATVGDLLDASVENFDIPGWENAAEWLETAASNLVDAAEEIEVASEDWLKAQGNLAKANAEANWAKNTGYAQQVSALSVPETITTEMGSIDAFDTTEDRLNEVMAVWNSYDDKIKAGIAETYPGLVSALADVKDALDGVKDNTVDAEEAQKKLEEANEEYTRAISKTQKFLDAKYFKNTAKAIKDLGEGTVSAADAYDIFYKECDKVTKAYDEIGKAQIKIKKGTELVESDVNSLADALGISADKVIADFPGAVNMFEELRKAGQEAYTELNKEATMRILGVSEADFSNILNGMTAVQDTADATVQMLLALGAFKLEEREVQEGVQFPIFENGKISTITAAATGKYQFLVPTGKNPFANYKRGGSATDTSNNKSGGGGGGGGDKNKDKNSMTEVERALDRMSQAHDIQTAQQNYYQSQSKYYNQTGQLQGVIAYSQKEIDLLKNQNGVLEDNIARIEAYMEAKRKELSTLSIGDAAYEDVADDLDKLQKAHQKYTKQLVDNAAAVDALNKEIDEQRKKIRQMQIDLRELIAGAIRDREEKAADMLQNEIEMEQTILDLITRRYEKERDEILENNQRRIDALQQEKDLLSEQLDLRKQMAEEEDKLKELAELEAQYQRISADPTRRKEALDIQKKIGDLRDEIAWDTAEKEVKAQQDSLDQQITSLEDYAEYIEEYYEDLFEHPQKMIEEMREILTRSDEEILAWLADNDDEYAKSTANRQKQLRDSWQDTLHAMRGEIETFWDEVEQIIMQGDDAIIKFLQDNSKAYAEAGKLQAEAYTEEWRKQLEDLRKAQEAVDAKNAANYDVIEKPEKSGKSGGGGGGGGSGSGGSGGSGSHGYEYTYAGTKYKQTGYKSKDAAEEAMKNSVNSVVRRSSGGAGSSMIGQAIRAIQAQATVYKTGGLADYTGLAWLDGTKQNPERVLSPYQTKLFESMVEALESMSRITIPSMPNYSGLATGGSAPVSVGDIIVNVDNLDTDDDYDEMAKRVTDILMERIGRTAVVGGLRINSF